jgi:PAS domain-containing protein
VNGPGCSTTDQEPRSRPVTAVAVSGARAKSEADLHAEWIAALNLMEDAVAARREAERAQEAVRWAAEFDSFRVRLADALRPIKSPEEVKGAAARVLGESLRADRVYYADVEPNDDGILIISPNHYTRDSQPDISGRFRVSDFGASVLRQLRADRPVVIDDTENGAPRKRGMFAAGGVRAFIAFPVLKNGRLIAVLTVAQATPRMWSGEELAQVAETVERACDAAERARAEDVIRANEEQFRRAIEDAPIPVIMHAEDGQVLQISRTWTELTGYHLEDIPTFES